MIYYKLDKQISLEKIAFDLNRIISRKTQQELQDSVLVLSIQKISDYAGDSLVPKIEYKMDGDSLT